MRPRVEVVAIEANSTMMDLYMLHQVGGLELTVLPFGVVRCYVVVTHWKSRLYFHRRRLRLR